MKYLIALIAACLLTAGMAQNGTPRKYDKSGTVELEKVYHVDLTKDKTLRALGYTEAMLPDTFPAFTEYWRMHGWPRAEMLDLYLFECAWNDVIYGTDGYYGKGFFIRSNFISESRAGIDAPCGMYRVHYGCLTARGIYTGKGASVSSDATGTMLGGTAIMIDHAGWSPRQPNRVCLLATNWGRDYNEPGVAGQAYQEGVQIEHFRLMGNKSQAGTFAGFTTGLTLNEPGEQSGIRYLMAEDFKGAGYTVFNGTPFVVETCSAFENDGPGLDLWGSNGLCNVRVETESGDNTIGQVRIRPRGAGDVGGGTISIDNLKCEARNKLQIPILIEGVMGDLNLIVDGLTADFKGVTCPYLIGGNWTGTQFEINVRGLDLRSNTLALAKSATMTLTGGKQYSGNSFVWNDEGLAFKSRSNMQLNPSTPTCSWIPGAETCGTCTNNTQTCTTPYVTSVAGCTPSGSKPADVVRTQACGTTPPPTGAISRAGWTATASHTGANEQTAWALDASTSTVWTSGRAQQEVAQWFRIDMLSARSIKRIDAITGWAGDHPRNLTVYLTNSTTMPNTGGVKPTTGATWSVNLTGSGRYVYFRINQAPGVTNWSTIADLQFY